MPSWFRRAAAATASVSRVIPISADTAKALRAQVPESVQQPCTESAGGISALKACIELARITNHAVAPVTHQALVPADTREV